uniref:Ubiquitin-like domain-containing protein n=1 Tax=Manihot esculenta TaxID=3983 RepID=A0A199U9Y4_MANES
MGDDEIPRACEAEGSETMIEIKIKTLDSQTYTLRVDKQMPVPALKEQIASVTGVLSEQQRLICRGKVLKDDQLLSAYRILYPFIRLKIYF